MRTFFLNFLFFPLDLLRFTRHTWQFLLEGYFLRFQNESPDYMCPFCRDVDLDQVPMGIRSRVKYRNIWMIRLLAPQIKGMAVKHNGRKIQVPVWTSESSFVVPPGYTPILALGLFAFWVAVLAVALDDFRFSPNVSGFVNYSVFDEINNNLIVLGARLHF